MVCCFFFFKQKTAYEMRISDWSSDVCSSDLPAEQAPLRPAERLIFFVVMVRLDSHASLGKRQPTCDATAMVTDGNMLELGRNCWRIEHATQATVIVDADEYFKAARAAMLKAKKQILLVGWDFDARIRLGEDCEDEGPQEVGAFFSWLVALTPGLPIPLLLWDTGRNKTFPPGA